MKELILLGAGASIEAGIPGAYEMTEKMLEAFSKDFQYSQLYKVLKFVVGGLFFQQGTKGNNPYNGVNIEDLFNAVILLGDRYDSELSPFIASWHPALAELETGEISSYTVHRILEVINKPTKNIVEAFSRNHLQEIRSAWGVFSPFQDNEFQRHLTQAIREVIGKGSGELFLQTSEVMIEKLFQMVWVTDESKIKYLIPLINYASKNNSTLVTLNYDNTIEFTATILQIETDTGIEKWSQTKEFTYSQGCIPLIKLHGSIDWALADGEISNERPLPSQKITKFEPNTPEQINSHPAIVFGGKNKLTAKGPFLDLLRAFEQELELSNKLTIIGYSFADAHVNEFIGNWLNSNQANTIRIINPYYSGIATKFIEHLHRIPDKSRVQIVEKVASEGIVDLFI